jgi:sulfatase-like protein
MPVTSAVVLVIDRLGAGWLGPYGNTWLDTPNFNRLAAHAVLCESILTDAPDLNSVYRSYWTGRHPLEPIDAAAAHLPALAETAGAETVLLTDDSQVAQHALAATFSQRRVVPQTDASKNAASIEQTELFAFFDAARAAVSEPTRSDLLWLHSRGMSGTWDAPLELRYQFADEDDPQPPDFIAPSELLLGEDFDPDALLGFVHAYAGQVALLDMCLGMLLDALEEHPRAGETLLVVTSPRGYPLGEHRRIGPCDDALYGELLHVPLLIRFPSDEHALARSTRIAQPHETFALVAESCGWTMQAADRVSHLLSDVRGESFDASGAACAISRGQRAIRTPAWFLRESQTTGGPRHELFAKPDDRYEANEVASRCGDVVELLAAELDRFESTARAGRLAEAAPLAELLCDVWR